MAERKNERTSFITLRCVALLRVFDWTSVYNLDMIVVYIVVYVCICICS